jgi:TRAP-type C4-dicarboxylate transport system permease small subunit
MSVVEQVAKGVRQLLDGVIGALLAAIVLITLAQVIARYLLGSSLIWSEELNRLLHLWLVMLAAAKASHLRIGLLEDRLPPRARMVLDLMLAAVSLGLLALMVRGGLRLSELTRFDMFTGIPVSMRWMFLAFVVGAGLWMARIILTRALAFRR